MPIVQRYTRQQTIPGKSRQVLQNPTNAGLESQAIAKAFGVLGDEAIQLGDVIVQRNEELKRQKRISDGIRIKGLYDEDRRAFMQSEAQANDNDIYTNLDRGNKFEEDSYKKYVDTIEDPDLKLAIKDYISSDMSGNKDNLAKIQAERHGKIINQSLDREEAGAVKDAALGLKPIDELISNYTDIVKMQLDAKGIRGKEAEDRIVKTTQQIAEAQLNGLIVNDPIGAEVLIKAGVYNKYLPGDKINAYAAKAKLLKEAREQDAKEAIEEAERLREKAVKEAREQTGINFAKLRAEGKLTEKDILSSNLEGTGENSINSWLKSLEDDREKKKKGQEIVIKTNPVIEAEWYEKIDAAEDPSAITNSMIRADVFKGNLTVDDANKAIVYRDKLIKGDDPLRSEAVKIARVRLNDAKTKKLFNSDDPAKNSAQWGKYNSKLTRYIENNSKATPEEIEGFVDIIMEPIETEWVGNLIDIVGWFGKSRQEMLEEKKQAEKEAAIEALAGQKKGKKVSPKTEDKPPAPGARLASDGKWYIPDPKRKGKYLRVD